jgi:hypothetical protein
LKLRCKRCNGDQRLACDVGAWHSKLHALRTDLHKMAALQQAG